MKLIFLDFDGVLNSTQSNKMYWRLGGRISFHVNDNHMCPIACSNLQHIYESVPDLHIVISSTWRKFYTFDELKGFLKDKCGIPEDRVIDVTPLHRGRKMSDYATHINRGDEIQDWLDKNTVVPEGSVLVPKYTVEDFMIIDDNSDMVHLTETNFLQTDPMLGLTIKDANKIIDRFKGNKSFWDR